MSKTPLQQLIEAAQNHTGIVTRDFWITQATALLPTEREVIKEAFEEGINPNSMIRNASHYFTTKFNDNEHTKS